MENNKEKCEYETHIFNHNDHSLEIKFLTYEEILENFKSDLTEKELKQLKNMENKQTTFLERLILEEEELGQKIVALSTALNKDGFSKIVGDYQFELLALQHSCMISYRRVLIMRINDLKESGLK